MILKWATPDRQAHLVHLWEKHGNKCLLGHPVCPNPAHYCITESKRVVVGKGVRVVCVDKAGEPRHHPDGRKIVMTVWGEKAIVVKEVRMATLYGEESETAIQAWKEADREKDLALWKLERRRLHSQPEFHKRGQYDSLEKEKFLAKRPLWDIVAVGVGASTFQRVLKVSIPGLDRIIWVNLPAPKGVSKNKRHKILRYGKGKLPEPEADLIYRVVSKAVKRALSN